MVKNEIMPAPVPQTCPDINAAQKRLKAAIRDAEYIMRRDMEQDVADILSCCVDEMSKAIDVLEDMRSSNSSLRDWGDGLEDDLQRLQSEYDELENNMPIN